jgi:hypothetical protein
VSLFSWVADAHRRLGWLALTWGPIVMGMASLDALSALTDGNSLQSAGWLVLFTLGVIVTIALSTGEVVRNARLVIGGRILFFLGLFAAVYNVTWMAWEELLGGFNTPVSLFPFPFVASAFVWYGLIVLGALLLVVGRAVELEGL